MKIKELNKTVNVCWSPKEYYPEMLATGSAAQQVDASFSSSSHLELYSLNLEDPGYDLKLKSSLQTQHKFQKIVWSGAGVVVGGCDGGLLQFYSVDKLLNNSPDALVGNSTKHTGEVSALDMNPYQKNLLASGAADSEIFIWDLYNTAQPMAPGARSQPHDHVQALAWNQQVQHILGSTFSNRCVVWDLRKNEPIMKLSDSQSRTRWRSLAWHPSVATQLCIASEDDQAPVIQLWDLRLASSPLVSLEGHTKGVLSLSWSPHDSDLLLSAGKDGQILCWNPNNTTPGGEMTHALQGAGAGAGGAGAGGAWPRAAAWAARSAGLAAAAGARVALLELLNPPGATPMSMPASSNILESFGAAGLGAPPPAPAPAPAPPAPRAGPARPPRWLRRPVRARFAFGGKLVTFEKCPEDGGSQRLVHISQVVSEPALVVAAARLDEALAASADGDLAPLAEYCREQGDACADQNTRYMWFFLRANFLPDFRSEALNLLGFKQEDVPSKCKGAAADGAALSRGESTETDAELSTDTSTDMSDAQTLIERKLGNLDMDPPVKNIDIPNGEDTESLICRALVCGNLEEAVDLCLDADKMADALIIASLGGPALERRARARHLRGAAGPVALLAGALRAARWPALVRGAAPAAWRHALAALLTHAGDAARDHAETLGARLAAERGAPAGAALACFACAARAPAALAAWRRLAAPAAPDALAQAQLALLAARAQRERRGPSAEGDETIERIVGEYAWRLASQGCAESALRAGEGAGGARLAELRARLRGARGQPARAQQTAPYAGQRTRTSSGHSQNHAHVGYNETSNTYNAVPPYAQQTAWAAPRPASVGPQGVTTGRSKYKVDPSVQAAPLYGQYSFSGPAAQPGAAGYAGYDQYAAPAPAPAPNGGYYSPAPAPEAAPAPAYKPAPPGWNDPPVMSKLKPTPHGGMSALHAGTRQWSYIIEHRRHNDEPKAELAAQAPITHPLFGVEPPQHIPLNPAAPAPYPGQYAQYPGQNAYPGAQPTYPGAQPTYPGAQPTYPGAQPAYPAAQEYPAQYYQGQAYAQQPEAAAPAAPAPPAAPEPAPKPPLPEEFVPLQTFFDTLRAECSNRAPNPQMKRKLEDVQRRLESLYDLLREYRLSEAALEALRASAEAARGGELAAAGARAAALAAGADFASVAAFLPGLKVLFQLALQLQVRVD